MDRKDLDWFMVLLLAVVSVGITTYFLTKKFENSKPKIEQVNYESINILLKEIKSDTDQIRIVSKEIRTDLKESRKIIKEILLNGEKINESKLQQNSTSNGH